mgnify:CR=1 FL=1
MKSVDMLAFGVALALGLAVAQTPREMAIALGVAIFLPQFQAGKSVTEQDTLYISAEDDAEAEMLTWLADAPVEVPSHFKGSL